MHSLRTTVWCGFWAGGVIGPFFFETDEGTAVTVDGERYRDMISWLNMEELEIEASGSVGWNAKPHVKLCIIPRKMSETSDICAWR